MFVYIRCVLVQLIWENTVLFFFLSKHETLYNCTVWAPEHFNKRGHHIATSGCCRGSHFILCHYWIIHFASHLEPPWQHRSCDDYPYTVMMNDYKWYHVQHHKLFRWTVNNEFSDAEEKKRRKSVRWYLRASARLYNKTPVACCVEFEKLNSNIH